MACRIAAVGEVGEDLYLPEGETHLGGISANFARAAARAGARTALFSAVGDDAAGARVQAALRRAPIDDLRVRALPGATAVQRIEVLPGGERRFCGYEPGVLTDYRLAADELRDLVGFDALALSCAAEGDGVFRQALAVEGPRFLVDFSQDSPIGDPERPETWVGPFLGRIAVAFVGGRPSWLEPLRALSRRSDTVVVLTGGAAGAWVCERGEVHHEPARNGPVVDTTGCGDAFQGAFAAAWLDGAPLAAAAAAGAEMAARVARSRGSDQTPC